MRAHWLMIAALPLALAGCDADGDGLSNAEEAELGTNPDLADTDGDGIGDLAESTGVTDPLVADTDGDGFDDGRELEDGTDPVDFMSYVRSTDGEWPDLSGNVDESTPTGWGMGDRFQDFTTLDQYGQDVSLYQFWGNVVLVDFSAGWCGPCRAVAQTAEDEYRAHADDGFVIFHFMIDDNQNGGGITDAGFTAAWADQYGLTFPVTDFSADWQTAGGGLSQSGLYDGGIPFIVVLDQEMTIQASGRGGAMMAKVEELLAE